MRARQKNKPVFFFTLLFLLSNSFLENDNVYTRKKSMYADNYYILIVIKTTYKLNNENMSDPILFVIWNIKSIVIV